MMAAGVRPDAGRAARFPARRRGQLAALTACRGRRTRFPVAQDARTILALITTRNRGNVGKNES
jgi:hypothetical protein